MKVQIKPLRDIFKGTLAILETHDIHTIERVNEVLRVTQDKKCLEWKTGSPNWERLRRILSHIQHHVRYTGLPLDIDNPAYFARIMLEEMSE